MGRLFWKFFLFVWLAQLAGALGTGLIFWFDRERFEAHIGAPPPPEFRPPPLHVDGHRSPPPPNGMRLPPLPVLLGGLLGSLLCAAGLAWYVAKPIRQLRGAFVAAAEGNLDVRIGESMGKRRDELSDLGHDFDRMSSHLCALMDGQRRLLHDVSHELRSPLARLHAAIGLARQQPARLEDTLQRIEREGERMNRLVGELLTLSRLEAGVGAPLELLDLDELIGDLVEDARFEAASRRVTVNYENHPNFQVRANGELLHRAVENVLRNALRFSPLGGVVTLVVASLHGNRCRMTIEDQGPGVPADELEKIFAPFYTTKAEGMGIGLAICRSIIEFHQGRLWVEARREGGSVFRFTVPIEENDD